MFASRHVGRQIQPLLTPIPVSRPFDRVGVDVIQLPKTIKENKYAVVFMDYLTKWPEVFATSDQPDSSYYWSLTLLIEHVIPRHGVPAELLSNRGKAFLSCLTSEMYKLMGIHKMNTTAYHPQTCEWFNRILIDMLAKTSSRHGADWDDQLPFVLFAYWSSLQHYTRESPFFLLYGCDPRLPTEEALPAPTDRTEKDLDVYRSELMQRVTEAWTLAWESVKKAQLNQKRFHDRHSTNT